MATNDTPELGAASFPAPTTTIFPQSSFFTEFRAPVLPSPAEVRALNAASGHDRAASFNRPPGVTVPSLGLAVKYGADITMAEIETQAWVHERLQGHVPTPEVFGWADDGGQKFIYMSLVEGDTLQKRFGSMSESERQVVCEELRSMVHAWRALPQEPDKYIGSTGKHPLNDIFVANRPGRAGPFLGLDAAQTFHDACGIDIDGGDIPVVFTHNDLCPPNVLLSRGLNPRVVAILDWGQAGWYPSYWEYCKARRVGVVDEEFTSALQDEWHTSYLPKVIDKVGDELYHPWLYFMLSNI